MGIIQNDLVIGQPSNYQNGFLVAFNEWLQEEVPKKHKILFFTANNNYGDTFVFMIPDGSKEGWTTSNECNEIREKFLTFLKSWRQAHWGRYLHVSFGEQGTSIEVDSDDD